MNTSVPIYVISLPNYRLDKEPDYLRWGKAVDEVIKKHFIGKEIAIRALSLADHPRMTTDKMIHTIIKTGSDKYDSTRQSFWHKWEVYKDKGIELFLTKIKVGKNFHFMHEVFSDFFEGAVADRGYAVKLDIITIYDPSKLECIPIQYSDNDIGEDAWKFLYPHKKQEALLGIIKIKN